MKKLTIAPILFALLSSAAHATTIDFEGKSPANWSVAYPANSALDAPTGFMLTTSGPLPTFINNPGFFGPHHQIAYNGTSFIRLTWDVVLELTSTTNTPFSVNSIDLVNYLYYGERDRSNVTLTGTYADGRKIVAKYTYNDDLTTAANDFHTETLAGFTNLVSFSVETSNYYLALDNIVINQSAADVPEPASLAMLGLGFAGIVATRRRKKFA